jgi:hypothetical protein
MNKWGMVTILALLAALPVSAVTRYLAGSMFAGDVAGEVVLLLAIICGVAAVRRGTRWWLAATLLAALWALVVLLQFVVGE